MGKNLKRIERITLSDYTVFSMYEDANGSYSFSRYEGMNTFPIGLSEYYKARGIYLSTPIETRQFNPYDMIAF